MTTITADVTGVSGDGSQGPLGVFRRLAWHLLVWTVFGTVLAGPFVQSLLRPKSRVSQGETVDYASTATLATEVLTFLLLTLCAAIVVTHARRLISVGLPMVAVMLAPWLYLVIRAEYDGSFPALRVLSYPAIVLAVWVLRPSFTDLRIAGHAVVALAGVSIAMGVLLPAKGVFKDALGGNIDLDKALTPYGLLVGPFNHPNVLGTVMALGFPMVLLSRRLPTKVAGASIVLFAIAWAGSRASIIALLMGLGAAVLIGLIPRAGRTAPTVALMLAAQIVVAALPLLETNGSAFTNRGYIWQASLERAASRPWTGLGANWYTTIGKTVSGLGPTVASGHNQYVHARVTGGLVLVGLIGVIWFAAALATARIARRVSLLSVSVLMTQLVVGMFEVPLPIVDNWAYSLSTLLPLCVIVLTPAGRRVPAAPRILVRTPGPDSERRRFQLQRLLEVARSTPAVNLLEDVRGMPPQPESAQSPQDAPASKRD